MIANAFIGKTTQPSEAELAEALGPSKRFWDELAGGQAAEWNSYSSKAGWALRLKAGKRNIVYLSPGRGAFTASFALGEKAMAAARESGLPKPVLKILDEARRYAEGTAVRIEVGSAADLPAVRKLIAAKIAN